MRIPTHASDHEHVADIVDRLEAELGEEYHLSPGWHDRRGECIELVIEGPETISPDRLKDLAGDLMPHGILLYDRDTGEDFSWTQAIIQVPSIR